MLAAAKAALKLVPIRIRSGLYIGPDGALVDANQYRDLSSGCQASGRPTGRFANGPCDAWWKTEDKIFAAQHTKGSGRSGTLAAIFLADGIDKYLDPRIKDLIERGGDKVTFSLLMHPATENGQGALWYLGDFEGSAGRNLGKVAKGLALFGAGLTIWMAFDEESGKGRSGFDLVWRTAVHGLLDVAGGAGGGLVGGSFGNVPGAIGGTVVGSGFADWLYSLIPQ